MIGCDMLLIWISRVDPPATAGGTDLFQMRSTTLRQSACPMEIAAGDQVETAETSPGDCQDCNLQSFQFGEALGAANNESLNPAPAFHHFPKPTL